MHHKSNSSQGVRRFNQVSLGYSTFPFLLPELVGPCKENSACLISILKPFIFMLRSRAFLSLALRRFSSRPTPIMSAHVLPADTPLEEEENPDYDPKRFYPARVGGTIQKYQIVSKLGWGTGSTVWLVRDINRFVQCPLQPTGNNNLRLAVAIKPTCGTKDHQLL